MGGLISKARNPSTARMQLNFPGVSESYVLNLENESEVTMSEIAEAVAEREGAEDVLLYVKGRPLDMEMAAADLENCTVDVSVPLKGGKVHGSLARVRQGPRP